MKRLFITLLTLLVIVGCSSELDRCIEKKLEPLDKEAKELHRETMEILCNKEGVY